jgi:hypothetical protein
MYSTSVALTRCFLSDPSNPALAVIFGSSGSLGGLGQRTSSDDLDGEFRQYAGGRIRLVLGVTTTRSTPITLRALTPTQARQVRRWRGALLLLRDTYGLRVYGSYLGTQQLNIPRTSQGNLVDLAVQFQAVTYSDRV